MKSIKRSEIKTDLARHASEGIPLTNDATAQIRYVPAKMDDGFLHRALEYLDRSQQENRFANHGPCVRLLEGRLHELLDLPDTHTVVATCSGTSALHALAGSLRQTGRVIRFAVAAFTFPCNRQQILSDSVIVDIGSDGLPDLTALPAEVDGVIATNCFGHLMPVDRIQQICEERHLTLLFDNAACPYSFIEGVNACAIGDGTIFSLHHTKPIGFGEGGAIVVDKKHADMMRRCAGYMDDNELAHALPYGSNFKLSESSAAFLLAHLDRFLSIAEHHIYIHRRFIDLIKDVRGVQMFPHTGPTPLASCLPVLFDRPTHIEPFHQAGIQAQKYYRPLKPLPIAQSVYERIICLPLTIETTERELNRFLGVIIDACR